ncbi:MAG: type II secretion system major pseudopilin GspG [Gammaproteobacteria bacterium]|nr:type II secretion system major pseudopilin GspG [Gammaproteobacteria bacterium]
MNQYNANTVRWRNAGVTLIELMVVLVIIGLLGTVVVMNVMPAQDQAMVTKVKADISTLESALEVYKLDNLAYPSLDQGLEALVQPPADLNNPARYRNGGYIKRLPDDPWGHPYQYLQPGEHGVFDLYSLGEDGRPGGEGKAADIGNWGG